MSVSSRRSRLGSLVSVGLSVALPLTLATLPAHAEAAKPAYRAKAVSAADWQASQLTRGRIHNGQFDFDDWGLTIDSVFALAAVGGHRADIDRAGTAIERNYYRAYATFSGDRFAGPMAKVLLLTAVLGENPADFGGRNVRRQLLALAAKPGAGFESGRLRDEGTLDYSNTISQSLGVLGLVRTGTVPQRVVDYLAKQQCADGFFRLEEVAGETCDDSGGVPDVDATAYAVQALIAARGSNATVPPGAIAAGADWLLGAQRANGSFGGGSTTAAPNSNSTGLAAQALQATQHRKARLDAASWVKGLQLTKANTSGRAARDIGAIAYNREGLRKGLKNGIQKIERDQFRRATVNAVFAFAPVPFGRISR